MASGSRLLLAFTFAVAIVVGAVVALITGSWWVLGAAVLVHALGTGVVLLGIGSRLQQRDKPDPLTEARVKDEAEAPGGDQPRDESDEPKTVI
jgi:hypothetical protein